MMGTCDALNNQDFAICMSLQSSRIIGLGVESKVSLVSRPVQGAKTSGKQLPLPRPSTATAV